MKITRFYKKYENTILALMSTSILIILLGIFFDYYYQANDDIFIKNILAGVYTGTPEANNIQMHYPLSLILSFLYRIMGNLPIYGLFLCGCQYGCLFLLLKRTLKYTHKTYMKILFSIVGTFIFAGLLLPEQIIVQYTITSAMLGGTATFRFYTTDKGLDTREFIKANISNVFLVILAFLVRSEMLLLLLPLLCVAGVCKWSTESPVFCKVNFKKYLGTIGAIVFGLILSQGIHTVAYSSEEWKEFNNLFDSRTELYDYQFIPEYDENMEFYESIDLTREKYDLLVNYNFSLSEEITGDTLRQVAQYADSLKQGELKVKDKLKDALVDYRYRTFHETDYPWNLVVLTCYGLLWLMAWKNRQYSYLWKILFLGGIRTTLWFYIIMGGRSPERITHSLYFMELCILLGMIIEQAVQERGRKLFTVFTTIMMIGLGVTILPFSVKRVENDIMLREYANREIDSLKLYCKENSSNFYFIDVYSAVSCTDFVVSDLAIEYSEKIFEKVDNSLENYDLLGGWLAKSPLTDKKRKEFEIETIEESLLDTENVYVIIKTKDSVEWLVSYYGAQGKRVEVVIKDEIFVEGNSIYTVYQINSKGI